MAIHWQVKFRSLRSGTVYTANVYDSSYSGSPIELTGADQPFTTEEDQSEDPFTPIRTQSGYLRIVDTGYDKAGNPFNWRDIIPATDTDRPVTLTHVENGVTVTDWQGFMQSQNFGSILYGNPQEREFPLNCPLSVIEASNIDYNEPDIKNFAHLLRLIYYNIYNLTSGTIVLENILVQGGLDAQSWLLKQIDWQNFVDHDTSADTISAKYNLYEVLESICRFWGWTARVHQRTLYLTCADDTNVPLFLRLTINDLNTMESGTAAGTATETFTTVALTGEIFASENQNDYLQRGANRVTVKADANPGEEKIVNYPPVNVIRYIANLSPQTEYIDGEYIYYREITAFPRSGALSPMLRGDAVSGYGSFSYITCQASDLEDAAISIKKTYNGNNTFVSLETIYEHSFSIKEYQAGGFYMHGWAWQKRYKVKDYDEISKIGRRHMYMRFGIGKTRNSAKWYDGRTWGNTQTAFLATLGNEDNIIRTARISNPGGIGSVIRTNGQDLRGKLFIDFLGSLDLDIVNGERAFFLTEFNIEFKKVVFFTNYWGKDLASSFDYKAQNNNYVRQEWSSDCIYASNNYMKFGYGVLINQNDGSAMETVTYGNLSERPEQHLANRVANYWASSKRKLDLELRSEITSGGVKLNSISPMNKATIDGTSCYPISISHDWREDVTRLLLLELP